MEKLLIGCAVAAMLMTTAAPAKAGSDWVGPAIVGAIFGVVVAGNSHGHSEVIIERRRGHHRHHRRHHRYRRMSEWVEVCGPYPHMRRDRWGNYYTVMRHECRVVKRAIW